MTLVNRAKNPYSENSWNYTLTLCGSKNQNMLVLGKCYKRVDSITHKLREAEDNLLKRNTQYFNAANLLDGW